MSLQIFDVKFKNSVTVRQKIIYFHSIYNAHSQRFSRSLIPRTHTMVLISYKVSKAYKDNICLLSKWLYIDIISFDSNISKQQTGAKGQLILFSKQLKCTAH